MRSKKIKELPATKSLEETIKDAISKEISSKIDLLTDEKVQEMLIPIVEKEFKEKIIPVIECAVKERYDVYAENVKNVVKETLKEIFNS